MHLVVTLNPIDPPKTSRILQVSCRNDMPVVQKSTDSNSETWPKYNDRAGRPKVRRSTRVRTNLIVVPLSPMSLSEKGVGI